MVAYQIALGPEFDSIPDDTEESLRGSSFHQEAIFSILNNLHICAARRGLAWFVGNQQTLLISREDRRLPRRITPDIFVHPTLAMTNPTSIAITEHGPPTLAIEIASLGTALVNDINTLIASCRSGVLPRRMVLLDDTELAGRTHERRPDGNGLCGA